ncbi:MAG: HAMP domain-containing protein [Pyrinomonadaceae bacterium]|nr:HAMP domain-containing protein [Pyrinomonadaceae bacterium]
MNDSAEKEPKKRNPPWLIGLIVLVSFTLLILLQSSNLWKNLAVESASDTLLLYALSSLNFFALVIFGFIFIRSILKLVRERRALQLGSKIKTRLLLYFVAISILPIVAMAVFSYLFMNRAIERWFTQIPENVAREARLVQEQAIIDRNHRLNDIASLMVVTLAGRVPEGEELDRLAKAANLTRIEILSERGEVLSETKQELDPSQREELEKTLTLLRQNKFFDPSLSDGRGYDAATARFPDGKLLVVVPDLRPNENVSQLVDSSLREFDRLKEKQITIRQIGFLTLGVLTFLLIFASSWTAFYVAKGLTRPIRALAEGADEIARGNLSHRVEILAEDELAMLVEAFNQMSETLVKNSQELRERRKYIETVLQSLSTGVISVDSENRVMTINKAAVQMFKLDGAAFENLSLEGLVSKENFTVLERVINRAKRTGRAGEQTILHSDPPDAGAAVENIPVALSAASLALGNAESPGVVLVVEDLSELIAAQRASAWQEVARRMAHEIKNPLTPIQLSAERIVKNFNKELGNPDNGKSVNGQLGKVVKESTDTILREVSSLKSMVDEFSRYARLPSTQLESGDLNSTVQNVVTLYHDRGVSIETDFASKLPEIPIDEEQIKRVFVNLIENSIEAFRHDQVDKKIFVKTLYDPARSVIVAQVADNGDGVPPKDFPKVFQPYFSTKGRGSGLGLAIVQRIIFEHGGKIYVGSNAPNGAKFTIELPVISA